MLHDEVRLHTKLRAFLDAKRFALQGFECTPGREIDGDVWALCDFESKRFDDAAALVGRVNVEGW